ncbi:unnamed protein product, partial [Brenthis ino]
MRCEFPMLTRCCFCLPLRLSLMVWAYIKTISSAVLLSYLVFIVIDECTRLCRIHSIYLYLFYIPICSMLTMDIIFHIIFIISAHKKEHRKMRLFYRYSIFSLMIYISGLIFSISLLFIDSRYFIYAYFFGFFHIAIFLWIIVIQIYVLILVRSEVVKLKRNMNFEFVNHAAEPGAVKEDLRNVEEVQYY